MLDKGTVVAYRQVRADDGTRLAEPRVFLPDGRGGWEQAGSAVDSASYEGWLASANKAHDAARTLFDIAARSGPAVPEHERLANLSDGGLRDLLHGSLDDVKAAVYEAARRSGVALRWTQMSAADAFSEGKVVNMAAGEGKSWLFLVDAARQAVLPGVDAVQVITTRANLADREFEDYRDLLTPLGFDIHRMNSDSPPPRARQWSADYLHRDEPGCRLHVAEVRSGTRPECYRPDGHPRSASTRSMRRSCYSNTSYIHSKGVACRCPRARRRAGQGGQGLPDRAPGRAGSSPRAISAASLSRRAGRPH